jgi:transcription termination/antitermination protein NusA
MKTIQIINAFEGITNTEVRDCVEGEGKIYFLVNAGKAAMAIGKGGARVQTAEKLLGKQIRVLEFDENPEKFIKNIIPTAEKIEIKNNIANVSISRKNRGNVIGRDGANIKILRDLISRNCDLEDLKIL